MASDKKQEQAIQKEFDGQVRDIRQRLNDQFSCVDRRYDVEKEVLQDFQEFFQSRSDLEKEYAKNLERLYDKHAKKRRLQSMSKDSDLQLPSTIACWNVLMDMTRSQHKQHLLLGTMYGDHLGHRFSALRDGLESVYRKSREMTGEVHMEILRVINELFSALKSYHNAHSESKRAGNKYKQTEQQISQRKGTNREKSLEKQLEKSMGKFQECQLKTTRARNDYLLTLAATNTTLSKYYSTDVVALLDCLDLGYVPQMKKTLTAFHTAELQVQKLRNDQLQRLELSIKQLDPNKDKELFISANPAQFEAPALFRFQSHCGDDMHKVICHHQNLFDELGQKYDTSIARVSSLNMETVEIKKSLDTVMSHMRDDRINIVEEDISRLFHTLGVRPKLEAQGSYIDRSSSLRRKHATLESEMYYLEKYKEHLQKANSEARIQARVEVLQVALDIDSSHQRVGQTRREDKSKPRMRKRPQSIFKVKLFGGDLEDYVATTSTDIPIVVESCIEFITLYGLDIEGVFRMPGAKTEVNEMKDKFDNGEDPLPDLGEKGDVHLVASLLKAYFRDLPEPLFPARVTMEFLNAVKIIDTAEKIEKLQKLVESLPTAIMVVMRYLFQFLKTMTSHSDENMMDAHNLSVCFGPTLLWAPEGEDPVTTQTHIIDVVDNMILFVEELFPKTPGTHYKENSNISPSESIETISEGTIGGIEEEEQDVIAAFAKTDYMAKTGEEMSFRKGQHMSLITEVNSSFWRGTIGDQEGLIPKSHINIPELCSPESSASPGFRMENFNRLNNTLSNHSTSTPDIVQDLPKQPYRSGLSPMPVRAAPPVKPKPMRPLPSLRRPMAPSGSKAQT